MNNAHVDGLGVLLTVIALTTVNRHRVLGGMLLGAAAAAKLLPAVTAPGALSGVLAADGRTPARRMLDTLAVLGPAALVVALAYLPYALASRGSVLGYFFGYLTEEGYDDAEQQGPVCVAATGPSRLVGVARGPGHRRDRDLPRPPPR
ncbi:hypothetical protein ACFSTC_19320 [Nonomuraea ferruginea]